MPQTRTDNTELFERMPVPRAVLTMAIPSIISQLIVLIYNMADTFFIGRTNDPYMVAGASLILPALTAAISSSSESPPVEGISRWEPAATPATWSLEAPQSDTTKPSKPHWSRRIS